MKAVVIEDFGGPEQLKVMDIPAPLPTDHEVQIAVAYAGVNPIDCKVRMGLRKEWRPHYFPLILGWDVSGTVASVGKLVKNWKIGDQVFAYCRKPIVQWGAYAEYVCVEEELVARKPKRLPFDKAAAIPLVALTAWQVLFDCLTLKPGQIILIHAGAGGIGSMAIQFAKYGGAKIITTASSHNHDYVKKLGADVVIDYSKEDFVERVKTLYPDGIDVVFDTMGGDTMKRSFPLLKPSGSLVSIVSPDASQVAKEFQREGNFLLVTPNGEQLKIIASLIEQGKVVSPEVQELPLEQAALAHQKIEAMHTRGKIVLRVK